MIKLFNLLIVDTCTLVRFQEDMLTLLPNNINKK